MQTTRDRPRDVVAARALPCPYCDAEGRVRVPHSRERVRCPTCNGSRRIPGPAPVVEV